MIVNAKRIAALSMIALIAACSDQKENANQIDADSSNSAPAPAPAAAERPTPRIIVMPTKIKNNEQAILNAVTGLNLVEDEFDDQNGDTKDIGTTSNNKATIQPHKGSREGGMTAGKLLARVRVEKDTDDKAWKNTGWNYWFTGQSETGEWFAVMVNLDSKSVKTRKMSHWNNETHDHAEAKWRQFSGKPGVKATVYAGWVTCDGNECCCEGKTCGDPIDPDSIRPHGPPDSLPPHPKPKH